MKKMTADEIKAGLAQCYGSEQFYRHPLSGLVYTEGILFLAKNAGACWLLDLIGSYQRQCKKDPMLCDMQFWKLKVDLEKKTAVATCERDTDDVAITQVIEYTDFPLESIEIYVENNTILLPSER